MVEKKACGGGSNDNDTGGCMGAIVVVEYIPDGGAARSVCASHPSKDQGTSTKPRNPLNHPDCPPLPTKLCACAFNNSSISLKLNPRVRNTYESRP